MNEKKRQYAIERIKKAKKLADKLGQPLGLAFSGGKDSQCIYHLAQEAGVVCDCFYTPTTIDPPEVVKFVRERYKDVRFIAPHISFYDLLRKKNFLPTALTRFCCSALKETRGGA